MLLLTKGKAIRAFLKNTALSYFLFIVCVFLCTALPASATLKAENPVAFKTLNTTVALSLATVGSGGNYTTLKAAFDAVNAGTLTGAITLQIIGNTTETAMATLNSSGTGLANYTSVLIYATGTGYSVSGNINNPLISLNGADNVTIDGRVNATGTTANLAITNSNTGIAAGAVKLINSAEGNVIRYTTLASSGLSPATAIIYFISSSAGNGNDTNVIEYCNLTNAGGIRPNNGIMSYGTAGRENSDDIIRFNNFYNVLSEGGASYGLNISGNSTDWIVTGNSFYETAALAPNGSYAYAPVKISTASMHTVTGNFIGGSAPLCGGTAWTMNTSFATTFSGIFITGNMATPTIVQNNTIQNFNCSSTSANPWDAIYVASGNARILGNTIGSPTGTNSIVVTALNASAVATVSGGAVTGLTLVGGGSGFTTAPIISFSLAGATTVATATATISGGVVTGLLLLMEGQAIPVFLRLAKKQDSERKQLMAQLDALNTRMQNARIQKVDGLLDEDDFQMLKKDTNAKIESIEVELGNLSDKHKEINVLLEKGLNKLLGLDLQYINGTVEEKREIVSSMFPENLLFDGVQHRTPRVNAAVMLIYQKNSNLEGIKKGTNPFVSDLSQEVTTMGSEPILKPVVF